MQTLIALVVAAAAACATARPPVQASPPSSREHLGVGEYLLPRFFPHYLGYNESPQVPPLQPLLETDWLNKEIDRLNQKEEEEEAMIPYEIDLARLFAQDPYIQRMFEGPLSVQQSKYTPEPKNYGEYKPMSMLAPQMVPIDPSKQEINRVPPEPESHTQSVGEEHRKTFALTPLDKEYYEHADKDAVRPANKQAEPIQLTHRQEETLKVSTDWEPRRETRQNPNMSKQKHLLESDLGKLKSGLAHEDHLKQPPMQMLESAGDPSNSIYGVALIAAVGAAVTMALVGFAFGWYSLSKKAKAAADVDYPAYGVTGPTTDTSGDRKLAHSAHMYHYQHQKQQIIAMERNGLEQRMGSVSDPESEEENEEGDYTVYECPGFATTGDMEVKNPLFSEDPTPTTPDKSDVVKPQPKD